MMLNSPILFSAISVAVFLIEKVGRLLNLEFGKDTTAGLISKMMVENLAMPSQAKDVFCIWLISPLLRKSLSHVLSLFAIMKYFLMLDIHSSVLVFRLKTVRITFSSY